MSNAGLLHGLRVLDLSRDVQGGYCTRVLADHGAEVIRIETAQDENGLSPHQAATRRGLHHGKKSVVLDLGTQEGQTAVRVLCATSQVLVEDLGAGELDRLGLGYETLALDNPALIHAMTALPLEAAAGPAGSGHESAMMMAFGIMSALRHAEATGEGQSIDIPGQIGTTGGAGLAEDTGAGMDAAASPLRFSAAQAPTLPATQPDVGSAIAQIGHDTETYLAEMPPIRMSEPDKRALRNVFGAFATGVTVVTTRQDDGAPRGFTANSFSSVSLDPPLLLICIAKTAHSCETFLGASHFAVNILSEDQKSQSGLFASRAPDKFDQVKWQPGAAGMPLLEDSLASLVCERHRTVDAGDHVIVLGRVIDHSARPGKPLGYFQGNYFALGLEDDLVSAASRSGMVEIGAVLARGDQVLLASLPDGRLTLPKLRSVKQSLPALKAHLEKLGLQAKLDFLYAVYHETGTGHHGIYYHGTAVGLAPPGHKFHDRRSIPLDKVASAAERSMLTRYCEEFGEGRFGIYQGDETSGIVHRLLDPET